MVQRGNARRRADAYEDKGKGTLLDGYTDDEFVAMVDWWFTQSINANSEGLRDRAGWLVQHFTFKRGESIRFLCLSDLWTRDLGTPGRWVMGITSRQGKINQMGHVEVTAVMRHKQVERCCIGGVALYLFSRFHLKGEAHPDTSDPR